MTRARSVQISLVIPAHNEAGNIRPLVESLDALVRRGWNGLEVIVVDDGSTDGTAAELEEASATRQYLRVLRHRRRMGISQALLSAFQQARGEILAFYPADLQYDPQDLPKLLEPILSGEAEVVAGWRQGRHHRQTVSLLFNWLARWLFRVPVHDLNSIKAFRREVISDLVLREGWHRYLVILAADRGFRVAEVPIPLHPRHAERSKFGMARIALGTLDLLSVKFQLSFSRKPMIFFGLSGLAFLLLGGLLGVVAVYLRFVEHLGYRPLLDLTVLLILGGLSLFGLGFLAEAVAALRQEVEEVKEHLAALDRGEDHHARSDQP